jgi:lysophospholipid acyltransferase (LPLAT)-like uncharacterized protein
MAWNSSHKTTSFRKLKGRRHLPALMTFAAAALVRILKLTFRVRIVDETGLLRNDRPWPVIVLLWHNRLLFASAFFPRNLRRRTAALTSASRDGQYAADFLRCFSIGAVRGSSSRGGRDALKELRKCLLAGHSVALTPDGPRGPKYELQIGPVLLAEMTGIPLVPVSVNAPARWELGGWDRTQIPKPFSRVEFVIGAPIFIHRKLTAEQRAEMRAQVEAALMAVTKD